MTGTSLTEEIKSAGREAGLDMIGICAVDSLPRLKRLDHERNIETILPSAKVVIVGAIRMISSALESANRNVRIAQYSTMCLYQELNRVAYALSRFLDDRGYRSAALPTFLPIDMRNNFGLISDVSLRHAAIEAGLGTLGMNNVLITEEFGPRVRLMAVLTDAPLVPDTPTQNEPCDDCGICLESCPVGAISENRRVDVFKCARQVMKHGFPGLFNFSRDLVGASVEELHLAIKNPEFGEYWQSFITGIFYSCFECVSCCPIGR